MKTILVILIGLGLCDVASAGGCHMHRDIYCCDTHGRLEFDSIPDDHLEFNEVEAIMDTGTFEVRSSLDEQKNLLGKAENGFLEILSVKNNSYIN